MQIADVHAHLRAGYRTTEGSDDESWSLEFPELDQRVIVRVVSVTERPWLLVYAEVCPIVRYDSKSVIGHAATLAVGGLCAYDDRYYLQHSLPLSATTTDLDAVLYLVAHEAARLRVTAPTFARPDSLFAHYAE
jgi:hypothetical protein